MESDRLDKKIRPAAKVFLRNPEGEQGFCGPGMVRLLLAIKETGNVRHACKRMNMSYSKGWKLLKSLEACLGFPTAVRRQGGKGGGEAYLTDKAQAFLETHQAFLQDCQTAVQELFDRYYG